MDRYRYIQEMSLMDEYGYEKKSFRSMISIDVTNVEKERIYGVLEDYSKGFVGIVREDNISNKNDVS